MATVGIHYVAAALRCAERGGLDIDRLLAETGLDKALLEQPHGRVHGDRMTRLVQLIWAELGDEFMGCTEHPCKQGVFALMARHVLHYRTLGAMLEQGVHFYNLFTDDIRMQLMRRGRMAELEITFSRPELDPDGFYRDFWLVIWHRFSSWLVGQRIALSQVWFSYPRPQYQRELKLMFPCRHSFGRPLLKLSFAAEYLGLPCVRTQRELSDFLRNSPADLITIPGDEKSYRARIRSLLLHQGREVLLCPAFEAVAESFNISAQTLRRRLREEGTSYPEIKDEIRRDLAVEKLKSQQLGVAEIAWSLGFSEPRSFSRAFRHWTGVSPSAYLESRSAAEGEDTTADASLREP